MAVATETETFKFDADNARVMQLVTERLYSNPDIFLRELISNASDACDKLRFFGLKDSALLADDADLSIWIDHDSEAGTITIRDNGIGMDRDEVIKNLGTIARSGTKELLENLSEKEKNASALIGQFGVGFYSAFLVADSVEVCTRKAGTPAENGVLWRSNGAGEYTVDATECACRGTKITLTLKDSAKDYANGHRLRNLVHRYSEHLGFPIFMKQEIYPSELEEGQEPPTPEYEKVNDAKALWTLPKNEISDEDYQSFYKATTHDWEPPLAWAHNRVEGKLEYTSLLYIPSRAPFDLYQFDRKPHGLKLYIQRVFIMDEVDQFLPNYLRFVRGIIDCQDLPLNISREILQDNRQVETIKAAITKKVLGLLEQMKRDEPEKFATVWKEFGQVLKEGPAEDYANRERIAKLLQFNSTASQSDTPDVGLEDYVGRMRAEQDTIYYVSADNLKAAQASPHLEFFKKHNVEVLLLHDRIDEWLVSHLTEFDGKKLQSVTRGELDLEKLGATEEKAEIEEANKALEPLSERMKTALGDHVESVRVSARLTDSAACLTVGENAMTGQMEKIMRAAGQAVPESKPILEINPNHPLIKRLDAEDGGEQFEDWTKLLFDQATLADGGQLDDPAGFAKRFNKALSDLAQR